MTEISQFFSEISQFFSKHPWIASIVSACAIIASALMGAFITARISKASSYRASLDREWAAVQESISRVQASLRPLTDVVRNGRPKSRQVEEACVEAIINLRENARHASARLPHTELAFQRYSEVMIELVSLIGDLRDENDRIRLMESVAKLTMAQGEFEDQIRKSPWLAHIALARKWFHQKIRAKIPSNDMNITG